MEENEYPDFSTDEYFCIYGQVKSMVEGQLVEYLGSPLIPVDLKRHPYLERCVWLLDGICSGLTCMEAAETAGLDLTTPEHHAIYDAINDFLELK